LLIIFSFGLLLCILCLPVAALELEIQLLTSMSKHNKPHCDRSYPHAFTRVSSFIELQGMSKPIKQEDTNPFMQCKVLLLDRSTLLLYDLQKACNIKTHFLP
jgi:hypothetical protein